MDPQFNGVEAIFHHLGIPTSEPKPRERFSSKFGMYTSDAESAHVRIQWHRFEPDSPLHPLIRTVPHPAFRVADLDHAISGFPLLLGPYEPIPGFRAAMIEDRGFPIELFETSLTDEELWSRRETENSLYQ